MSHSAHGLRNWLLQRLTAVYLLIFLVYFFIHLLVRPVTGYDAWRGWLAHPAVSVATLLFFTAALFHAWIGLRDVVMDYLHPFAWRLALLAVIGVSLSSMGLWVLLIVTSLHQ
jgi:succinate dehydrogenase / fumarate reductase membrane anchor subunit